ncbi:hypothetical protein GJAV_G00054500 [Gymnothorax javanicus]|nr:hypothetical protein GJAV_G00054500 [Gymnothorax javanicus]
MLYLRTVMASRRSLVLFVIFWDLLCGYMCQCSQLGQRNRTQETVHAEVGGLVRLPCELQSQGNVTFMYMQRVNPPAFVNGFHHKRASEPHEMFSNRSAVPLSLAWVELWDVRVSDEGKYECILMDETPDIKKKTLYLKVTAKFSAAVVKANCSSDNVGGCGCTVTCTSSGGYPCTSVKWTFQPQVADAQWMEVNNSCLQDEVTRLYTSSSSIFINSSQPLKITCTVGGVVSQLQEVCNSSGHDFHDWMVLIASMVAASLFILVIIILMSKRKTCPATEPPDLEEDIEQIAPNTQLMELK